MQVRELKHKNCGLDSDFYVAPHAGAWIETNHPIDYKKTAFVAPHAGAWIETVSLWCLRWRYMSHLMQVRELKHHYQQNRPFQNKSHLMQVRELKPFIPRHTAFLKLCRTSCRCVNWNVLPVPIDIKSASHLMQVRELKLTISV